MWFFTLVILFVFLAVALILRCFRGADLRQYDSADFEPTFYRPTPSYKYPKALALIESIKAPLSIWRPSQFLYAFRKSVDSLGDREFESRIIPVCASFSCSEVTGEWVIANNADVNKRLLYIHGGGFSVGSAKSHRIVTDRLSRDLGVAVFAVDYQRLPDGKRIQGIYDCRIAYQWLLENCPAGKLPAQRIYMAGDSAGGNLVLSLVGWLKQRKMRQVDAAVLLCPCIDNTFSYASFNYNAKTDFLLNPLMGKLHRFPQSLILLWVFFMYRINPSDPRVSPVFADLSGLPPMLFHASDTELMVDDARRYVNKALAAGSDVRLQTWSNMLHVWHLFDLDEADEAYGEIQKFIQECDTELVF
jgi:monoterpene epsilon-lactone hydrolase